MDLVSAGQTRRRQGLLSLFQLWSLGLLGVGPSVVAFFGGWRTEEEYGFCFFLFSFFSILLKLILVWKWVEMLEM